MKKGEEVTGISPDDVIPHIQSVSEILLLEVRKRSTFSKRPPRPTTSSKFMSPEARLVSKECWMLCGANLGTPVEELNPFQQIKVSSSNFNPNMMSEASPGWRLPSDWLLGALTRHDENQSSRWTSEARL